MEGLKERKGHKGLGMEGFIATWYARNTGKNLDAYRRDARRVAERVPDGGRILDLAAGPGYLAIELARLGKFHVEGLDISDTFVRIATEHAHQANVEVPFRRGSASEMPFNDNRFDLVVCRAAFKNFANPSDAIREMHRVLKPRGQAVIIDLRKHAEREDIDLAIKEMRLSRINAFLTRAVFRTMLLKRAHIREDFEQFIACTPFIQYEIHEQGIEIEVVLTKSDTVNGLPALN
jgi:ubiquinone/menaquinone biosynthesis C-methylase UbiE